MSKKNSVKYFSDSVPLINSRLRNSIRIKYEKIKLNFSILNANKGSYSIQAKLYNQQVLDFFSETKKIPAKQEIVFEKFFNCDFYFERQQNLQITLNKNNTRIQINTTLGNIIGSTNCTFSEKYYGEETLVIKAEKMGQEEDLLNIKFTLREINSDPNFFVNNEFNNFKKR